MSQELIDYCEQHGLDQDKVQAFFKKAWQKNPLDRYQTPEEYMAALRVAFTPEST